MRKLAVGTALEMRYSVATMKVLILLFSLTLTPVITAADNFDGLECGGDLSSSLKGRKMNLKGPVMKIEKQYRSLELKDEGADLPEDDVLFIQWGICKDRYLFLEKDHRVVDVVRVEKSLPEPLFADCSENKKPKASFIVVKKASQVLSAWRINYSAPRFEPIDPKTLNCQ